jgi:RecA-family ATPase
MIRYKSKGIPDAPDFRKVAESVLGPVEWQDAETGFCACPGAHLHTSPTKERDCRVTLDAEDGYAPTLYCFHDSCREAVADANRRLRSELGKAEWRANPGAAAFAPRPRVEDYADPFEALLKTCFEPTDIVSIAPGMTPDGETRAVPEHGGVNVYTRDEWIAKVQAKGGVARLFSGKSGLYIRINPVTPKAHGGDKDVTRFRHTLIESDKLPKDEQEKMLRASGLPIAALIDSGGASIHAWVRVDAANKEEFHARRERVWKALPESFPIDGANKNPSRFSRCPGGLRGEAVQKLLALNLGPASFAEWESVGDGLGLAAPLRVSELGKFDTANDPNTVLGNRWLCRGGSLVVVGQSGVGKSSFSMQLAVMWALGLPVFNIRPAKPLRSLFIQAENDIGDLAEMFQGVREGMGLTAEQTAALEENLIFYRDTIHCGADFAKAAEVLIKRHKPDLVWGDPLLNYIGDDASQQKVISEFCGRLLNPISERTGIIWCWMHHTGKPTADPRAKSHWTGSDMAYSGLGSSALTNWAREVAVLTRVKTPDGMPLTFRFELCKRRRRAGMADMLGNPTEGIYVRHGDTGICWQQCADPTPPEKEKPSGGVYTIGKKRAPKGRPKAVEEEIEEFKTMQQLSKETLAELSAKYGASHATIKRRWKAYRENLIQKDTNEA